MGERDGAASAAPTGAEALRTLLRYLYFVADKTTFQQVSETMQQLPPVQVTGQTIVDWLEQQGWEKRHQAGHEQRRDERLKAGRDEEKAGRDERLKAARDALWRVLAWKKLAMMAEQEALIEACTGLTTHKRLKEQALLARASTGRPRDSRRRTWCCPC
jgi:hypothetical protein